MLRLIYTFLIFFCLGILVMAIVNIIGYKKGAAILSPDKQDFTFQTAVQPSQSLKGSITSFSGDVKFADREATEPAKLASAVDVLQGEKIVTGKGGLVKVSFPNVLNINISFDTDVDIIQTLPNNLVFNQNSGTSEFIKLGQNAVSVKAMHLLIDQKNGSMTINVDQKLSRIIVSSLGDATAAYNDSDSKTQTVAITKGKQLIFDDDTRTAQLKTSK